ncbi:hypothetical protein D3C72_1706050 [compost metagenome]
MAAEGYALLGQLAELGQRHDLEAAAIGEDRPLPIHEVMQPAQACHPLGARPQHQVIGIAEQDICASLPHLVRIHGLDCARRAHRHEGRRLDIAARRVDAAAPRHARCGGKGEGDLFHAAGSSLLFRGGQCGASGLCRPIFAMLCSGYGCVEIF